MIKMKANGSEWVSWSSSRRHLWRRRQPHRWTPARLAAWLTAGATTDAQSPNRHTHTHTHTHTHAHGRQHTEQHNHQYKHNLCYIVSRFTLQCFDTVGWASGRASGLQKLSDEVLMRLTVWSEVQIVCIMVQLMPLHPETPSSLASFTAGLVFTARCYASAVLAMGLCLCLSVTSRSSTKTAKRRITQTIVRGL